MSSADSARAEAPSDSPSPLLVASIVPLVPAWRVDKTFDYEVPEQLTDDVAVGSLVRMRFGNRRIRGVVTRLVRSAPEGVLEPIAGVVGPAPVAPPPVDELFRWLSRRYVVPLGKAFARAVPPRVRVKTQPDADVVEVSPEIVGGYEGGRELLAAIQDGRGGVWCFETVGGEDRPAVIAELVSAALQAASGAVLVCVPEVHYGSAVLSGLEQRFGSVARLDTNVPDPQRSAGLLALAQGHRLGAGGRAAVLAPSPELRLIVLDEEHHRTYKEDQSPRYDSRRVAIERASLQGATCVLLSPTPSVESGGAAREQRFRSVKPSRERRRTARPLIEVTDKDPERAISTLLHRRIRDALGAGSRVALLAPARGYARVVWCAECRRSLRCDICEGGLHFDRSSPPEHRLRCPRCGSTQPAPDACPHCGSTDFRWLGAGSERLAEQLTKAFPRARVTHVDPSSIDTASARARSADIYVTTWIGTKAAVRPDVSLVGIVDADALIRRPHFRAAEQAYQAFAHMAEWAGPAASGGRLVVQSDEPGHYVLQALARGDYGFFLERELEQRAELRYPPYCELVRIRVSGPEKDPVTRRAIEACRPHAVRVLGPIRIAAPDDALEVLIKTASADEVAAVLRGILPQTPSGTRLTVDVDPR